MKTQTKMKQQQQPQQQDKLSNCHKFMQINDVVMNYNGLSVFQSTVSLKLVNNFLKQD